MSLGVGGGRKRFKANGGEFEVSSEGLKQALSSIGFEIDDAGHVLSDFEASLTYDVKGVLISITACDDCKIGENKIEVVGGWYARANQAKFEVDFSEIWAISTEEYGCGFDPGEFRA
jgi:hypothetical protein